MPFSLKTISTRLLRLAQQLRLHLSEQEKAELLSAVLDSEGVVFNSSDLAVVLKSSEEAESICIDINESEIFEHALWIFCNHYLLQTLDSCILSNILFKTETLKDVSVISINKEVRINLIFSDAQINWSFAEPSFSELEQILLTLGLGHSASQAQQLLKSYYKRMILGKKITLLYYRGQVDGRENFLLFNHLCRSEEELTNAFQVAVESDQIHDFYPLSSKIFFDPLLSSEEGLLKIKLQRSILEVLQYEEGSVVVLNSRGGRREIVAALTDYGLIWNNPVEHKEAILNKLVQLCHDLASRPQKTSRIHNSYDSTKN